MLAKVMSWVSRHILLALFMCLFLLLSCGSSHKAIKSDTEVISKDSASETVNIVHESTTSLSELITTNGSYVINFRIYDTRKPPDSLTGKPPLLADGHVEGNFNKKEDKQTVVADTTNVKADKEATSIKHEKTKTEEVKKKKESTLLKQIGFACIFNKKEDKQTVVADTTNVKADKEATSIKHEKTKTEEVKKKKESTLLKQIGFACICATVLLVVMLLRQYFWRNNMTIFIIRL